VVFTYQSCLVVYKTGEAALIYHVGLKHQCESDGDVGYSIEQKGGHYKEPDIDRDKLRRCSSAKERYPVSEINWRNDRGGWMDLDGRLLTIEHSGCATRCIHPRDSCHLNGRYLYAQYRVH
jgi:hypothetical protein